MTPQEELTNRIDTLAFQGAIEEQEAERMTDLVEELGAKE